MRRNNDRDTKELISNDDNDLDFNEYVGLGFMVAGAIVGLCFWEIGGGIFGSVVGYLAFRGMLLIWTGITLLLDRRRH